MSREQLVAMAERNIRHLQAGTLDTEPNVFRVPLEHYNDPGRWRLEMERIFRRLPLVVAYTTELRQPGAYRSLDVAGTPVLVTRRADGTVAAFINSCSHRGAIVVPEGVGTARRFACPYHGWAYDTDGALVGVLDADLFGEIDRSCLGLTPLPVAERAGLIWAGLTPDSWFDLDTFLCGYDEVLAFHHFEDCHFVGRQVVPGPNWKIAYDGYLDFYHLPVLHRASFGTEISNKALYDVWGPHQRVTSPDWTYAKLAETPSHQWRPERLTGGVWTIFPHVSIASFDAGGKVYMVSQLFPGATPEESTTVQTFLHVHEPDDAVRAAVEDRMAFLMGVVRDEDYATGLGIQRAIRSRAKGHALFGRNEGGGQRFHRWVQAFVDLEDGAQVEALLRAGV